VPASSGLARITIRAPRRRLDLSVPHQVPLAELLPDVLRHAGEMVSLAPTGGWVLRRGDGEPLSAEMALARQGVRDGDVLYLVPGNLSWPEPSYDDVVEEIAAGARSRGRMWDAAATRAVALGAAGVVLVTGLAALLGAGGQRAAAGAAASAAALVLIVLGGLVSRALGDGLAGTAAGAFALPYAAVAGALLVPERFGPGSVLVGASALAFASAAGAVAVGYGLRVFVAGGTIGVLAALGAGLAFPLGAAGAASLVVLVAVAGISAAPALAVRLGHVPLPVVTADPARIAAEARVDPATLRAAVVRADEIIVGTVTGLAVVGATCSALLATTTGVAGRLLAGLAAIALLLRARLYPTVAARMPLMVGGLVGLAASAGLSLALAGSVASLVGLLLASVSVIVLLSTAATAARRRERGTPYLSRLADVMDITVVLMLAPVACAVLGLYAWVRGLAG
jgi:type VII secretion integral membrane protein EccD